VKLIDSRPLQIAMCALVLFDAAVVVAEILLDMHAIRSQSSIIIFIIIVIIIVIIVVIVVIVKFLLRLLHQSAR